MQCCVHLSRPVPAQSCWCCGDVLNDRSGASTLDAISNIGVWCCVRKTPDSPSSVALTNKSSRRHMPLVEASTWRWAEHLPCGACTGRLLVPVGGVYNGRSTSIHRTRHALLKILLMLQHHSEPRMLADFSDPTADHNNTATPTTALPTGVGSHLEAFPTATYCC